MREYESLEEVIEYNKGYYDDLASAAYGLGQRDKDDEYVQLIEAADDALSILDQLLGDSDPICDEDDIIDDPMFLACQNLAFALQQFPQRS